MSSVPLDPDALIELRSAAMDTSFSMNSMGSNSRGEVPSRQTVLNSTRTRRLARRHTILGDGRGAGAGPASALATRARASNGSPRADRLDLTPSPDTRASLRRACPTKKMLVDHEQV